MTIDVFGLQLRKNTVTASLIMPPTCDQDLTSQTANNLSWYRARVFFQATNPDEAPTVDDNVPGLAIGGFSG